MALTPRFDLRQSQLLVMTPQLQQAIKLLQFSSLDLSAYVETQLERNPLLERDEGGEGGGEGPEGGEAAPDGAVSDGLAGGDPPSLDAALSGEDASFSDLDLDVDYDNVFDGEAGEGDAWRSDPVGTAGKGARSGTFEDTEANLEEMMSSETTLKDHLMSQLGMELGDPVDRIIGVHLIDMLDESGYLVGDLEQLALLLNCPAERIEATLARLQGLDPAGVFARTLAECLSLQLRDRGLLDGTMQILMDNLELVGRRDWASLTRLTGLGAEQVAKLVARIRSLDPKPALKFDRVLAQPVTPDVLMRPQVGGGWIVELNSDTLPRVLVNNHYYAKVSKSVRSREDKQYLTECFQTANWLVKSLHQRATTILRVATEIVRQQNAFFVSGVRSLRPLVLRDIADAISMHESTVSRVTSNKFMATPRGIYELKYFFTHAVGGAKGGEVHSAESVRHRIRKMIDAEPPGAILSDDALADALQREGIDIARRTVAKYREAMRIPSSVQRRREKGDIL